MSETEGRDDSDAIARAVTRTLEEGAVAALVTLIDAPRSQQMVGVKMLVMDTESGGPLRAQRAVGGTGDAALDERLSAQARRFLASRAEAHTYGMEELFAPEESDAKPAAPSLQERWTGARVLFERIEPEPHVVVCGAGHVGAALARLARAIGYRVSLVDDRADFVTRERFPDEGIELLAADDWADALRAAVGRGRGVSVAVVTRGHNEDEECMRAVLDAGPDYVGMIGSRRRTNIVLDRLRESGADESSLREVRAPIGLDIGAVAPEEVALAILAEIVAARRGGTGAPLSTWRRQEKRADAPLDRRDDHSTFR